MTITPIENLDSVDPALWSIQRKIRKFSYNGKNVFGYFFKSQEHPYWSIHLGCPSIGTITGVRQQLTTGQFVYTVKNTSEIDSRIVTVDDIQNFKDIEAMVLRFCQKGS